MHPTLGGDSQPLGERDTTVRGDPDKPWAGGDIVTKVVLYFSFQPVRDGYLVQVGVLAVEEECVGAPDLVQELPVHGELGDERRAVVDLNQSGASIVSNQPIRGKYCQQSTNHSSPASRRASSAGSSSPVCTAPGTHL